MADLRALVEQLGYSDARTLLNSGNVVFTVPPGNRADPGARIETGIASRLGVTTRVTVLSGKEVAAAVEGSPFGALADNPSRLMVMVLRDPATLARLKPLLKQPWTPEALALGKRVAYLWLADGVIDSPLWTAVAKMVGDGGTARNIATMTKILSLVTR